MYNIFSHMNKLGTHMIEIQNDLYLIRIVIFDKQIRSFHIEIISNNCLPLDFHYSILITILHHDILLQKNTFQYSIHLRHMWSNLNNKCCIV